MNSTLKTTSIPPIAPMIIALKGDTTAQGAVITTKPANTPFKAILVSAFPNLAQAVNIAKIAPLAAAKF